MSDFVTTVLPTFYPVVLLGGKNTAPSGVKLYTINASFTGSDTNVTKPLSALTFRQAVNLLSLFTFQLTPGSVAYTISASVPTTGTKANNGGTLDTIFGDLCLSDLGQLLSQVTLKVNGQTSYQIAGTPEPNLPQTFLTFIQETIGRRSAGYLGIGLNLLQFTIQRTAPGTGTPVGFSLTTNKNHGE